MLNGIKGTIAESAVARIARDPNLASNVLGVAAGGLIASKINFGKLFAGDANEMGNAVGAVVAALVCYYIGKPSKK